MIKPAPPKARGIAGVLFVWLLAFATAGLLLDVLVIRGGRASLFAGPGGHALLGVGVALGAVLVAVALRFTLGRPIKSEGGPGARDHA
jgi:hypothetical protein